MAPVMSADSLLKALRAEGLKVLEYRAWRTHNRNHMGEWGPINGAMMHHTVTGPKSDVVALCYRGHANLPGPLCHGVITKDGRVHLVSSGRSNHAGLGDSDVLASVYSERYGERPPKPDEADTDGNKHFYGFEAENLGDGKDPWPVGQYVAMVRAAAAVLRYYGWTSKSVIAHREWQPGKVDPAGIDMVVFRKDVAACLAKPAGKWGGVPTKVKLSIEQRVAALEAAVKRLSAKK